MERQKRVNESRHRPTARKRGRKQTRGGAQADAAEKEKRACDVEKEFARAMAQCGPGSDPLAATAESNTWCAILRYRGVDFRALCGLRKLLPVVFPWDATYNTDRMEYNKRINAFPSAIAMVESARHVRIAIAWARRHGMPLHVRSGGHSFEGMSTGAGIVVDTRRMNRIRVDKDKRTARIQAGALIGPTYLELSKHGLMLAAGTCSNVGLAGLSMGGGVGFSDRKFGLTLDNTLALRMVLADGRVVVANARNGYKDLFWACQGAGGGHFGIVVDFKFRLHRLRRVTLYEYTWPWERAERAVGVWQSWVAGEPEPDRNLTTELGLKGPERGVFCTGEFIGPPERLRELLAPLDRIGEASAKKVWRTAFVDAARHYSDGHSRPPLSKWKSRFVYDPLPLAGIRALVEQAARVMPDDKSGGIYLSALGGAIRDVPEDATAFFHRRASYWIEWNTFFDAREQEDSRLAWIREAYAAVIPYCSPYSYVNFHDADITDHERAYWGPLLPKLVAIKQKYDPNNVFCLPHSIPLTLPAGWKAEDKRVR